MDSQKLENQLNLSLDANEEEREKSQDLDVGYDAAANTWELIVKYHGDLEAAAGTRIRIEVLQSGYAIARVPQPLIDTFAALEEVEYIEKPKSLYFSVLDAKQQACISSLQTGDDRLSGRGTVVCIVDSGLDLYHPDFRNEDGTTRLLYFWDQVNEVVYDEAQINALLYGETRQEEAGQIRWEEARGNEEASQPNDARVSQRFDTTGHGTAVAGIAVGNGRASDGRYRGVAYEAAIIAVRMGNPGTGDFPRTTQLMRAVNFGVEKALEVNLPIAVNISFGNNYGSHTGFSLLEQFLNDMSDIGRTVIVTGTGNEGSGRGHTGDVIANGILQEKELAVGEYQYSFPIQIWKSYSDEIEITIVHPSGMRAGLSGSQGSFVAAQNRNVASNGMYRMQQVGSVTSRGGVYRYRMGNTQLLIYYGEPSPYSIYQEIYIELIPVGDYVDAGIWTIELYGRQIKNGRYSIWLPSMSTLSSGTGFLQPTEEYTLTIPSTAEKVISVGAYDGNTNQPAAFSGRGYTWQTNQIKPELAAPGVDITTTAVLPESSRSLSDTLIPGGGATIRSDAYTIVSGTSFATPFVTGGAALLMQWGIVDGNDPYLYGEKVKAYLIRGARAIPGENIPSTKVGWGTLCVSDSIPI